MKIREAAAILIFFFVVNLLFFNKLIFSSVPFPGDLLSSGYQPWRSYSYLNYNPGSFPAKNQYFDVIRQLYPWKTLSIGEIKEGQLPLWNPYNFSGTPLLANFQSAVFYPLNFLYFILPQISAWSFLIFLQPLAAAFFTYLFCRNLNLSKSSSIVSALAYGFSLFMSVFLEYNTVGHVTLWLPLILFAIDKIFINQKFRWGLILLFSLVSSFFAGHLQVFFYVAAFSLIYFLFRWFQKGKPLKVLLLTTSYYLLATIITAVQWIPTFQLITQSARSPQEYTFLINQLLIQPKDLIRFFSPDIFGNPAVGNYLLNDPYPGKALYIGLLPIIFALLSLWSFKKNQLIKFFCLSFLIIFLFLFRSPFMEWFYKIQIPFFSTSSPSNVIFLLSFCLAILAGYGIEIWQKTSKKIVIPYFLILSLFLILLFYPGLVLLKKNLYYSLILIAGIGILLLIKRFWRKGFASNLVIFGLICLTIFDLYYFFNKFNPFVPKELVYPGAPVLSWLKKNAGINRIWGYGTANIESNFFTQEKLYGVEGYDPLYLRRYGEFIQASKEGKPGETFNNQNRSDAALTNGFGSVPLDNNGYRKKMLNLIGVKFILNRIENGDSSKIFPVGKYKLVYEDGAGWQVFENLEVLPRVFLVSDYQIFKNKTEFEKLFFSQNFDPAKKILLEQKPVCQESDNSNYQTGRITMKMYKENEIRLETNTSSCNFLFLSDSYYPGWKAYVDGKETKIYRADYAFRAIEVPAGNHQVIFSYMVIQ